jgi:spore coat polysaccharide biosynthesis protein SpsF
MNIGIIVQARMGSTRLPGKMLTDLNGQDLLGRVIDNLRKVQQSNVLIVATTTNKMDDALESRCRELNIPCFRGDEFDVLNRYYHAAVDYNLDTVIRIPGDNPFILPSLVDNFISEWKGQSVDYLSNILEDTFPIGMHVEIFTFQALEQAFNNALQKIEREHVTPYIYNSGKFKLFNVRSEVDYSDYRLTIDYPEDVLFTRKLLNMIDADQLYNLSNIVNLIDRFPKLKEINSLYWKSQSIK